MLGEYAYGTGFRFSSSPWCQVTGGRAMCPDGAVRSLARIGEPDTVWTRPAAVRVRGKYVRGYVTIESTEGYDVATDSDPAVLKFTASVDIRETVFPGHPVTWRKES